MTETPSSTTPTSPYGAPGPTGQSTPHGGTAFFDWVRGLGFVRGQDRWLAGVCGAVAARTGLDPMVVRGIAVVIAILGGPIFFLYAVGWALMPDESGRSLVEKAAAQIFEPAMIAVGALLLFTFIPWMQGIWWQGPPEVWGMPGWLEVLLRTSWAIGLTVGLIVLVIYIAKRVPSPRSRPAPGYGSAAAQPGGATPTTPTTPTTLTAAAAAQSQPTPAAPSTPPAQFVPPVPPVPGPPATPTMAATTRPTALPKPDTTTTGPSLWDDLTGPTPAAGSAEYGAAPPFDPERYRALHRRKRLGAGFVSVVVGLALSVGAVSASFVADGSWSNSAFLVGASAALAVIALGIVVAGIRGKEGGWLNFFSLLLAATMAWTVVIPVGTDVATFGDPTWQYNAAGTGAAGDSPTGFAMIAGAPVIDLTDVDNAPSAGDHTVDVWTAFGEVELILPENRTVVVEVGTLAGGIDYSGADEIDRGGVFFSDSRTVAEGRGTGVTTVRVWMLAGQVTTTQTALR